MKLENGGKHTKTTLCLWLPQNMPPKLCQRANKSSKRQRMCHTTSLKKRAQKQARHMQKRHKKFLNPPPHQWISVTSVKMAFGPFLILHDFPWIYSGNGRMLFPDKLTAKYNGYHKNFDGRITNRGITLPHPGKHCSQACLGNSQPNPAPWCVVFGHTQISET